MTRWFSSVRFVLLLLVLFVAGDDAFAAHGFRRQGDNRWRGGAVSTSYVNTHAIDFGGTNERITFGTRLAAGSTRFVLALWIYNPARVSSEDWVAQYDGSGGNNNGVILRTDNTGAVTFFVFDGTNGQPRFTTTAALGTGDFVHVCVNYDGSQATNATKLQVFFDGSSQAGTFSGTIPAATTTLSVNFTLGSITSGSNAVIGFMDDVGLWVGGNPPSCSAIYNSGLIQNLAIMSPTPTNCWSFDNDVANTITDRCGSNNGTMVNMEAGDIQATTIAP